jgi:hypothetical protein
MSDKRKKEDSKKKFVKNTPTNDSKKTSEETIDEFKKRGINIPQETPEEIEKYISKFDKDFHGVLKPSDAALISRNVTLYTISTSAKINP